MIPSFHRSPCKCNLSNWLPASWKSVKHRGSCNCCSIRWCHRYGDMHRSSSWLRWPNRCCSSSYWLRCHAHRSSPNSQPLCVSLRACCLSNRSWTQCCRCCGDSKPIGFEWPKLSTCSRKRPILLCATNRSNRNSLRPSVMWQAWCLSNRNQKLSCRCCDGNKPNEFGLPMTNMCLNRHSSFLPARNRNSRNKRQLSANSQDAFPSSSNQPLCCRWNGDSKPSASA